MSFLVFDIETAALPLENFDEARQEYLMRGAETEEDRRRQAANMSLNGLTARVVCIGMVYAESYDAEPKGFVLSNVPEGPGEDILPDGSVWRYMSETEMLEQWWEVLERRPSHLVSFNGRGFDCPFLMLRSAALKVKPSRNLMGGTRYRYDLHTDLQDELAFFGFSAGISPLKRFNLDFYCKAFGITSPKEEGVTGDMVPEMFNNGEHRKIAEYCVRDVFSTWKLFRHWKEYLDIR